MPKSRLQHNCPTCGQPIELTRVVNRTVGTMPMTVADIKTEVRNEVRGVSDKAIYNALARLVRTKVLRNMGYGIYSRS